jgi:hypothetical protein
MRNKSQKIIVPLDPPVGPGDDDAVLAWLVDACCHDGALVAVVFVKGEELLERELAGDVRVEHEKAVCVLENVPGEPKRPGGAHGLNLLAVRDLHSETLLPPAHLLAHQLGLVPISFC